MNRDSGKNEKSQYKVRINSRNKSDVIHLPGRTARILFSRDVLEAETLTIIDVEIDVGACTTPAHIHETLEEVMYIREGSARLWVEGEVFTINTGDAILVPKGFKHMVKNVGNSPLLMLTFYGDKDYKRGFVNFPNINKDNTDF